MESRGETAASPGRDGSDPIAELYDRAGHLVFRRCVQMMNESQEAMDATQWTFLRAIEVGFEVRTTGQALKWLYRTATQRCLSQLRKRRTRRHLRVVHAEELRGAPAPSAERLTVDRDLLDRAVAQVDDRTAEVALLTYAQGLSVQRAAEVCDISVRTVARERDRFSQVIRALVERSEGDGQG